MPFFKELKMPKLESVSRFVSIPIVEASIGITGQVYSKVRDSNLLFRWYLSTVEKSVQTGAHLLLPAVVLFERPIQKIDHLLCMSLDVVEHCVPAISLPTETMYHETRNYVMRRVDPVKALMDSKMTAAAVGALDRAVIIATKYVDRYIPAAPEDVVIIVTAPDEVLSDMVLLVVHYKILNRKLKRGLLRQALVNEAMSALIRFLSDFSELMYNESKSYVMQRADSVKQLGTAVLDSHVAAATVGVLDRVITKADQYVDQYLPANQQEVVEDEKPIDGEGGRALAVQVVQHSELLCRKLKCRCTRWAFAEAKAIKEQINVLLYIAKLVANDPALAWQKAKQLYASLSAPEPENQARPATVEELLKLLIREVARRVVHFINYTQTELARNVSRGAHIATSRLLAASELLIKVLCVNMAAEESGNYLEQLALFLAGNKETEKLPPMGPNQVGPLHDLSINGIN